MKDSEIFAWLKHNNDYIHIKKDGYDVSFNVYAWHDTKQIVCAFEETQQKTDWVSNFDFWVRVCNGFKIHRGYDKQWHIMESAFKEKFAQILADFPDYTILVTGWSLGADIALRAVPEVTSIAGRKVRLLSFGSPKMCWDKKTVEKFRFHLTSDSVEYCNRNDLVIYCPPIGFHHVCRKTVGDKFSLKKLFKPSNQHNAYDEILEKEGL